MTLNNLDNLFTSARSLYTIISFATFIGIALWAYSTRRNAGFEAAALLPFADEPGGEKCDG